ncbi:SusC/RagA family TonB-linked outer membrane protein [Sphingobacterium haloxyli]|uniref:SusC/RagA family TonB-linked outer membrane protein n=1 Tax=Sphingobacterium haloxyli TaxID=2100533 RepID=A0A2S9J8L0_9SPHI|nr:SusC/RagA family TonB-linked outer membrane protein [Sphingobacterium haloxyli]PRD49135.1 SusC/RagA family TonB-linked outer membrane protein [Sphingobacterium haloxyli]
MSKLYKQCCSLALIMLLSVTTLFAQQTVTGRVTDANGALAGVTVAVVGTTVAAQTDAGGNYSIQANNGQTLRFSTIGYISREFTVSSTNLNVTLQEDSGALDEVVVTAMGIKRAPKELGYAMSTVGGEELTKTGSPNFAGALYGKAPGVRISAAPGGATSGININIRGINSIANSSQPLVIIDGVPMRQSSFNNSDYWGDQRARGNGLEDLNPEDIESISILKGASAAALYGSEAMNGVVLVTTKSGKGGEGFSIDFNATYTHDKVGYLPRFQDVRGSGYDVSYADIGQSEDMFFYYPDGVRGMANTTFNFGPKFDGQPVRSWDGEIRPYQAQNAYSNLFNNPNNTIFNVALGHTTEKSNVRFSVTRQDNQMTALDSYNKRNIANLNSSFKLWENFTTDVVVNYINQHTHNRPTLTDRLINNFAGMISTFDNPDWYANKYQTSMGYKYVIQGPNVQSFTPEENIRYNGYRVDVLDYYWNSLARSADEYSNRVIGSFTNTWQITDNFSVRGRFSADMTNMRTEEREPNEIPLTFGNSGAFRLGQMSGNVYYTDLLATYKKDINEDYSFGVMGGYTGTRTQENFVQRQTEGGLHIRDWYDLNASVNLVRGNERWNYRRNVLRDAVFGTVNFDMKDYWFVEGTLRRERISTMHPDNNVLYYPSVNSSLILSEAFELPAIFDYAKLRGSWGVVGNYPTVYQSPISYKVGNVGNQGTGTAVLHTLVPTENFGNESIKPETKTEIEFGLETRFLNGRLGLDVTYYNGLIRDQILYYTLPNSTGANAVLANAGSLRNRGWEFAITGTPISGENFRWNTVLNFSMNKNVVEELPGDLTQLLHRDYDGAAAQLVSKIGSSIGDIMVRPIATDAAGNKLVNGLGLYQVDADNWIKAGNYMPKAVGGFVNNFNYKNFSLDVLLDFRWGGQVMPTGVSWMTGRGLTQESLNYMDAASGGISYYINADGKGVAYAGETGPAGERIHHDGMLMEGVLADGSENTNVISHVRYYAQTYNWGGPQYSNSRYELFVKDNNYIKMRELSIGYRLPTEMASRLRAKNLQISAFGRNLFFIYRSIKDIDPEQMTGGSYWVNQVTNAGTGPATRTFGVMLRASF